MYDGTAWAWGANDLGQLGIGSQTDTPTPTRVSALGGVSQVAAGQSHSLALLSNGTVYGWGHNNDGQIGNAPSGMATSPVAIEGTSGSGPLTGIWAIAAGQDHSVALQGQNRNGVTPGTVYTWGLGSSGQLGNGPVGSTNVPQVIPFASPLRWLQNGRGRRRGIRRERRDCTSTLWERRSASI